MLNTLSTASMVRLGKTHGNLMVDVAATNAKLMIRARRIIAEATGVTPEAADEALTAADGQVKTAVVALLAGVDVEVARERLVVARGRVRSAVGQDPAGQDAAGQNAAGEPAGQDVAADPEAPR